MPIGLKRGVVALFDHDPEWSSIARETIARLWGIFGSVAKDIQHVGSTSIIGIKAKPMIDIAVAVDDSADVETLAPALEAEGFMRRNWDNDTQLIFAVGEDVPPDDRITTHFIHIVKTGSAGWGEYVYFRDYLNALPDVAKDYEAIKVRLATENPYDPGREKYLAGKRHFIIAKIYEARIWMDFNKEFVHIEPITKGWSEDKKFCVTKTDGTKYLLRISPIERYEVRKSLFAMLQQVAALGIPMCEPVAFGTCDTGVYSLQSWIGGEDLVEVLPRLTEAEQYALGLQSGEIARKMHSIPAPALQEEWAARFGRKTDLKIQKYRACGLRFAGDDLVIDYIEKNRHLLAERPQCFQHGDYHVGNMMLEHGKLEIIDFDRYDFGDPWEEFNRIVWSAAASPHFATGQLRGYFGGEVPLEFFKLLAFYIASNTLSSIYWAMPFGPSDLDTMMRQAQDVLRWFDGMRSPVPSWYLGAWRPAYLKPQSWPTCDAEIREYINGLVHLLVEKLGENLIGVYLHGSLAMGSYFPPKSDMDLIVVTAQSLGATVAEEMNASIVEYAKKCPTVGHVELSVITLHTAKSVPSQMPYELYYSEAFRQTEFGHQPIDPDLPAHLLSVKKRGVCLHGEAIDAVFGEVQWEDFLRAVLDDFDWIAEDENICESPYYCILNICRVLQLLKEDDHKILSKLEGGLWGVAQLPCEFRPLIEKALAIYTSDAPIGKSERKGGGVVWDKDALLAFRDYARNERNALV
ncbi:MAG: GrpB family protein [Clostridiales bacterium]|nr:GrpB family protein [Clostridiales bacterium]